jgi:prepilin-type processing-associated H-X9-DG protein
MTWDEGHTLSSNWLEGQVGGHNLSLNNGIVEPCEVYEHPYVYVGWAISPTLFRADADFVDFELAVQGLIDEIATDGAQVVEGDWAFEDAGTPITVGGKGQVYRLREGIERFLISDINNPAASAQAQSELPVMWDEISGGEASHFNHVPGGCNILYMDGHVAFTRYVSGNGAPFPVNGAGITFHEATHAHH